QAGGGPGGNIRQIFRFRTDRRLSFVDRPGGDSTTPTIVTSASGTPQLSFSPGRIDPTNTAWDSSRKPLAAEFLFDRQRLFVIANHFNSKGGDQPLTGRFQPPTRSSEVRRHQQATIEAGFVQQICAKLRKAAAAQDRGDLKAAQNILKAFANEVNAQRDKAITSDDADLLILLANRL